MSYKDDKLFFEPEEPGMSKLGAHLGKDTQLWTQQIKVIFEKENSPIIRAGGKPFLDYTYKDMAKGTAVGAVTITVGGRILMFPVVIKDNELAPFDNYYDQLDKDWHFMTDKRMDDLVNNNSQYRGLTKNIPTDEMRNDLDDSVIQPGWRDPLQAHRKSAALSKSINMHRMKDIAVYLDKNPAALYSMEPKVANLIRLYSQASLHVDDMLTRLNSPLAGIPESLKP
jgi:hypothetical protein